MKTRTILALALVLSFLLGGVVLAGDVLPDVDDTPMCRPALNMDEDDLVPYTVNKCMDTGDAYYECSQLLEEYDWAKRIGPRTGSYAYMEHSELIQTIITEVNRPPTMFNWTVDPNPLGTVIVKSVGKGKFPGGLDNPGMYMIYTYGDPAYEDSGLTGYYTVNGSGDYRYYQIDHLTFCWNKVDDNGDDECYQEETAWAFGDPYNPDGGGNWGWYVPYFDEELEVLIYAGQNMLAGTATFSAPVDGEVTITITLEYGFVFYYDAADNYEDENLKVQEYYDEAPTGNPAIGHFDWKASIEEGSTTASITVPAADYYGVHLDVAYPVECPTEE